MTTTIKIIGEHLKKVLSLTADEFDFLSDDFYDISFYYAAELYKMSIEQFIRFYYTNETLYCYVCYATDEFKPIAQSLVEKIRKYLDLPEITKPPCF